MKKEDLTESSLLNPLCNQSINNVLFSLDNKLLAASDQTKDIECGLQTNTEGKV